MSAQTFTLTVNQNGQITIPSNFRKIWGLKPNTKIKVLISSDKTFKIEEIQDYNLDDLPNIVGQVKPISDKKINSSLSQAFKPLN